MLSEQLGKEVLITRKRIVMKGDKVISEEILYTIKSEPPKTTLAPIQIPKTPSPVLLSSPKKDRPEFLEPLGISPRAEDTSKLFQEGLQRNLKEYLEWEANQPSTWERELKKYQAQRVAFTKKAAWSAKDMVEVNTLDKAIKECEEVLNRFYEEESEEEE